MNDELYFRGKCVAIVIFAANIFDYYLKIIKFYKLQKSVENKRQNINNKCFR